MKKSCFYFDFFIVKFKYNIHITLVQINYDYAFQLQLGNEGSS